MSFDVPINIHFTLLYTYGTREYNSTGKDAKTQNITQILHDCKRFSMPQCIVFILN